MPPASTGTHVAPVGPAIDAIAKCLAAATTPGSDACRQRARETTQSSGTSDENQRDDELEDLELPRANLAPMIRHPRGDGVRIKDFSKMYAQLEATQSTERQRSIKHRWATSIDFDRG